MVNEFISRDLDMDIIYFADIENAPYGNKSKELVQKLVSSAVDFLLSKKVDAILLACNTATSVVVEFLRVKIEYSSFRNGTCHKTCTSSISLMNK
jgi:glutamate racemase